MDTQEFLSLESDITTQLAVIDNVFADIEDRTQGFDISDPRHVESVAYQIHNAYSATEELLRLIANYFENQIGDVPRWHSALIRRMTQPVPGVRPAPLTKEAFLLLDTLRGFRHFFRHAYASTIDPTLLQANLQVARQAHSLLHRDMSDFLDQLRPEK